MSKGCKHCIVAIMERNMGYTLIDQLNNKTTASFNRRVLQLIELPEKQFKSITADNGAEFNQYRQIKALTEIKFYFW